MTPGERLFALLLRLYPRDFQRRYRADLLAFFRQDRAHKRYGRGPARPIRFWTATGRDLAVGVWRVRKAAPAVAPPRRVGGWRRLPVDLRDAWRGLRATRAVTASIVALLALGLGAGTAMFSVVDAVALRGLPFDAANELVAVHETDLATTETSTVAAQNYFDWRQRQDVLMSMAASAGAGRYITQDAPIESLRVVRITASLFDVLRAAPAMGRRFQTADETAAAPRVAILSDRFWRRRFGARPDVIGQWLRFEAGPIEIVGVMPPEFVFPIGSPFVNAVDIWIPFVPSVREVSREGGGRTYSLTVIGRLAPGRTIDDAHSQFVRIRDALAIEHPRWFVDRGVMVEDLHAAIVGTQTRAWMLLLLGAVAVVLVIVCLNVANLLLARGAARGRDMALRAALGASRGDLVRGMLVESLLLAAVGTAAALAIASWTIGLLRAAVPEHLPRLSEIALDARVAAMTAGVGLATAIAFGVLPALHFSRPGSWRWSGTRATHGGPATDRTRTLLVVAEIALAVVLLAGAAAFATTFLRVVSIDLGLDPRHVVTVGVSPRTATSRSRAVVAAAQAEVIAALEAVRRLPGVDHAAAIGGGLPLSGGSVSMPVQRPGRTLPPFTGDDEPYIHGVTADYLQAVRARLIRGRWVRDDDRADSTAIVILSDVAVRRYFGEGDALGEILLIGDQPRQIVGVVQGVRHHGPERQLRPEVYVPFVQDAQPSGTIVARVRGDAGGALRTVEQAVRHAAPAATLFSPQTLEQHFGRLIAPRQFNMLIIGTFGVLAVATAGLGVYGLIAFMVGERTRELGVRLALGAPPAGLLRLVLRRAGGWVTAGLVVGLIAAAWLERFARAFLYEARPYDPLIYVIAIVVLTGAGLLAAIGPARRAARVDPLLALRSE